MARRNSNNRRPYKDKPSGTNSSKGTSSIGSTLLNEDFGKKIFANPAGRPINLAGVMPTGEDAFAEIAGKLTRFNLPGIMKFFVLTGPGESTDGTSAVNLATRSIYTFMRNAKNGYFQFEQQDVALFMLAMDNVFMLYAHLCRLYRTIKKFDGLNRYLPTALVRAMGFDYDDIKIHYSDLKGDIDVFAHALSTLYVPENFPIIRRHFDLYRTVYEDHTNSKSQLYLYAPRGFHVWSEILNESKVDPYLKYYHWEFLPWAAKAYKGIGPSTPEATWLWRYEDIRYVMDFFINTLTSSDDVAAINGAMLSVYGDAGLFRISPLEDESPIEFEHSLDELMMIHNATVMPRIPSSFADMRFQDITQNADLNKGWLIWKPKFQNMDVHDTAATGFYADRIMDSNEAEPTANDVAMYTRFMCIPRFVDSHVDARKYTTRCGTEILTDATVYTNDPDSSAGVAPLSFMYCNTNMSPSMIGKIQDFDYAPIFMNIGGVTGSLSLGVYGELDNFTNMGPSMLDRLKESDIMYLWNLPIGSSNRSSRS